MFVVNVSGNHIVEVYSNVGSVSADMFMGVIERIIEPPTILMSLF